MREPWVTATIVGKDNAVAVTTRSRSPQVSLAWQVPGSALDPFNSLPIEMPFKSKELFHYCESIELAEHVLICPSFSLPIHSLGTRLRF